MLAHVSPTRWCTDTFVQFTFTSVAGRNILFAGSSNDGDWFYNQDASGNTKAIASNKNVGGQQFMGSASPPIGKFRPILSRRFARVVELEFAVCGGQGLVPGHDGACTRPVYVTITHLSAIAHCFSPHVRELRFDELLLGDALLRPLRVRQDVSLRQRYLTPHCLALTRSPARQAAPRA